MDDLVLQTGDSGIDRFFGGGIYAGQVTEIYGKSGTGKTCFALQLAIQIQLDYNHIQGSTLYISTSGRFPIKRLAQLVEGVCEQYPGLDPETLMENIHIIHIRDLETQTHILKYQIPNLMEPLGIKLIVFDSFSPNFRYQDEDGDSSNAMDKAKSIFETGKILHQLAGKYNSIVLCLNEVGAKFDNPVYVANDTHNTSYKSTDRNDGCDYVPALGVAQSVIVNNRIRFHRNPNGSRTMYMVYSPQAPESQLGFELDNHGIHSVD